MSGGCTIAISLAGGLRPGSRVTPENIRAEVYVPPHLMEERPHLKPVIATLVQSFIKKVGLEVSERWLLCAEAMNWDIQHGDNITGPRMLSVFPKPAHGSCHYTFWGRTAGELEELIAAKDRRAGGGLGADSPSSEVVRLLEEIQHLEEEVSHLRELLERQRAEIAALRTAEKQRTDEGTSLTSYTFS